MGRDREEELITKWLNERLAASDAKARHLSSVLYVCGHPGQGKTAIVSQVLHDQYGDQDICEFSPAHGADSSSHSSSIYCGGGREHLLLIFKHNAMSFKDLDQFLGTLAEDMVERSETAGVTQIK